MSNWTEYWFHHKVQKNVLHLLLKMGPHFPLQLVQYSAIKNILKITFWIYVLRRLPVSCIVCIVTGYGLDDQGVRFRVPVGSRIFTSPSHPDWLWGPPRPPYPGFFPGIKWQEREADHLFPISAEVKKTWIYTSTPSYAFMAQCLIS
jgi:hypothetical protein